MYCRKQPSMPSASTHPSFSCRAADLCSFGKKTCQFRFRDAFFARSDYVLSTPSSLPRPGVWNSISFLTSVAPSKQPKRKLFSSFSISSHPSTSTPEASVLAQRFRLPCSVRQPTLHPCLCYFFAFRASTLSFERVPSPGRCSAQLSLDLFPPLSE